jgi:hypothetical protein
MDHDIKSVLSPNQLETPMLEFITGWDPKITYMGYIGGGGQGDVYLVSFPLGGGW